MSAPVNATNFFVRLKTTLHRLETDPATAKDPIKRMFIFDGQHLSANVSILHGGGDAMHIQPHHDELVLILDGECGFRVGEETTRVERGDLVFIPRGTVHGPVVDHGPVATLSIFGPHFDRAQKNILWSRDGFA
jgi:quercetin dioxygenase-like cupin family protein